MKQKAKKIIHHLRGKSEETRRHILHMVTIFFGCILVLLWIVSLGRNLSDPDTQNKMAEDIKPFSNLKDNMVGGYNGLSDQGGLEVVQ